MWATGDGSFPIHAFERRRSLVRLSDFALTSPRRTHFLTWYSNALFRSSSDVLKASECAGFVGQALRQQAALSMSVKRRPRALLLQLPAHLPMPPAYRQGSRGESLASCCSALTLSLASVIVCGCLRGHPLPLRGAIAALPPYPGLPRSSAPRLRQAPVAHHTEAPASETALQPQLRTCQPPPGRSRAAHLGAERTAGAASASYN